MSDWERAMLIVMLLGWARDSGRLILTLLQQTLAKERQRQRPLGFLGEERAFRHYATDHEIMKTLNVDCHCRGCMG